MKISFSTLGCPSWTTQQIFAMATKAGYDGVEFRFVQDEAALWKLPEFRGEGLTATKRAAADHGVAIACVDTSCFFHWPDPQKRKEALDEGARMIDIAAALGAPGIRIFGDRIQPGANRMETRRWVAEGMWALAEQARPKHVEVWLETHGDFANSQETMTILREAGCHDIGAIWDPENCFVETHEAPAQGGPVLGAAIRHVHLKDLRQNEKGEWQHVLTGEGTFPLLDVLHSLQSLGYNRFASFEWEKKWHPEIPDPEIALPQFAQWFRHNWPS